MAKKIPTKTNNKTIVITGTASFRGAALLKALENDPQYQSIVAVDYKKPPFPTKKTRFHKVDLTETLADEHLANILKKENCDTLIHCAIPTTPPKNQGLAHELISVGTLYVFNACAEARVRKVILASTSDVYGAFPTNPNFLLEDFHTPKGDRQSSFLADKISAEKEALKYAKKYPDRIVTILRFCTILGPTYKSYKTQFLRRPIVTTILGFDPLVQFLHEDDLVKAFNLAITQDCPGIFNIVGDGVLPLSRVINILGNFNLKLPQIGFKTMVQTLWYLDMAPAPASHVDFLRYLCVADGAKARNILGFTPRFSTKEALLSFVGAERLRDINLIEA